MSHEIELLERIAGSLRRLEAQQRVQTETLQDILERLPKPVYPQTTGLSITVRN
jgi:hypothetical protein